WGSRAAKRELRPMDWWISTGEAAVILRVTIQRVRHMCDSGLLPCYQREPGKMGSRIKLSHTAVMLLSERPDYLKNRARWEASRGASGCTVPDWEDRDLEGYD